MDADSGSAIQGTLRVAPRVYEREDLACWEDHQGLTDNERTALQFCREWLGGAESFVVRTSGSTGEPKPITLTRTQMEASARATAAALNLHAGDRALVCLPTRYIAGRMMLVRGLVLGLHMILVEPAADPLASLSQEDHIDFAAFVPLQLQTLLDVALTAPTGDSCAEVTERSSHYRNLLNGMKAILVGGAPVGPALEASIRRLDAPVYHTYGMTETATHIALRRLNGVDDGYEFKPLPGVAVRVDKRGCLAVCGPMSGEQWLQTNDIVDLRPNGAFVWAGRWDNVVNSGGVKIQVERVEATLGHLRLDAPEAAWSRRRCFIVGLPDDRLGQVVTLVMEGTPLSEGEAEALRGKLSENLEPYETPRRYLFVPHFRETSTGKIDRKATLDTLIQ